MTILELSVLGVQPLFFTTKNRDVAPPLIEQPDREPGLGEPPEWVAAIENLYPNRHFQYKRLQSTGKVQASGLSFDLSAYLCANTSLNQYVVLFDLRAAITPAQSVSVESIQSSLVLDDTDDRAPLIKAAIEQARAAIAHMSDCDIGDISVDTNSCNVTLILQDRQSASLSQLTDLSRKIIHHGDSERLTVDRLDIPISDATRVFFGGRAHIVITTSDKDLGVIRHVLFMLQVMWFFVPRYLRHAAELHRRIIADQDFHNLDDLEKSAMRLIYCYQAVSLQNEAAKFSYESLADLLYEKAQSQWGVERTIGQLERYTEFFRAFIRDVREDQARKSDSILNYILAILGMFGLVGLWADILAAQVSIVSLASLQNLLRITTSTKLGMATVGLVAVSAAAAVFFTVYSIKVKQGRRKERCRRPGRRQA